MILLKYLKIQLDANLKIILLDHQSNNVGNSSMMGNTAKNCDILGFSLGNQISRHLNILHNYFDSLLKLFLDLYLELKSTK